MKQSFLSLILIWFLAGCTATRSLVKAEDTQVLVHMDLVNIEEDKVLVTLDPGAFSVEDIHFYIPKTVPGTYSIDNYGKFIEAFKAFDYDGKELIVQKPEENTWYISSARNLDKISYYVNDTFDQETSMTDIVFSPAGTNIEEGKNFMLNLHGFLGYFAGLKEVPYEIVIDVPSGLTPTTSLKFKPGPDQEGKDIFIADRYFEVIDNPIMYAQPNNASFLINDINITIGVYSPNNAYRASDFKDRMEKMMMAQKDFLGNIDSTEEYNILLYLSTMGEDDATGFGALEHHTSTVVVFPEQMPKESLEELMVDVVSHEFFHIVTPLNVHSKEIHYFDYNNPKMSEHLWMYEGTTEYFANLFQIQQGLIDESDFYKRIIGKIDNSLYYDDAMSFTAMSSQILQDPYKDNYANVYEKGALISMCLDILLRDLSDGEKGILWLMKELSSKYDSDTPFEDANLIPEIVSMTYPEIGTFFSTHVQGETPIDYEELFSRVGLTTSIGEEESGYFFRGEIPYIDVDMSDNSIFVRKGIELNSFFQDLGILGGDTLLSIDGTSISLDSIRPIIGQSFTWNPEKEITVVVLRNGEQVNCQGKVGRPMVNVRTLVQPDGITEDKSNLREAWLKG
ncbi:MAG: peptidase M61 [Flavobacteriaceae bacterium]